METGPGFVPQLVREQADGTTFSDLLQAAHEFLGADDPEHVETAQRIEGKETRRCRRRPAGKISFVHRVSFRCLITLRRVARARWAFSGLRPSKILAAKAKGAPIYCLISQPNSLASCVLANKPTVYPGAGPMCSVQCFSGGFHRAASSSGSNNGSPSAVTSASA